MRRPAASALVICGLACGLVGAGWAGWKWFGEREPPAQLLRQAQRALDTGNYERAAQLAARIPESSRESADACLIAGEAATHLKDYEQAIRCYEQVPQSRVDAFATATYCIGDLLLQLGDAAGAEARYRKVLALRPDDPWSREQLASLLVTFGRRWEALPVLVGLLQTKALPEQQLLLLGELNVAIEIPVDLEKFRRRAPTDAHPVIALARTALEKHEPAEAARLAQQVIDLAPDQIEGWALRGVALADLEDGHDPQPFLDWYSHLPELMRAHPDVWVAQGNWARKRGEIEVAIRCYFEAVQRFPDSRSANYQLGQMLLKLEPPRTEAAAPFLDRAERLEQLRAALNLIYRHRTDPAPVDEASRLLESLGRIWEAAAWNEELLRLQPQSLAARRSAQRLRTRLSRDLPRVDPEAARALILDLTDFPLPDWKPAPTQTPRTEGPPQPAESPFSDPAFVDVAAAAELHFQYFNGADPPGDGKLIYQNLGGGVGVLDYDGDLRPDLYFAQGARAPNDVEDQQFGDVLFRNRGDGRFQDVTRAAGLGDRRHTHGVAAGDVNNDGFPDLYLANSGTNRLYLNNGDGSFRDISDEAGIAARFCTASVLIADLNGDSVPDLFDVNYLAEPEVYQLTCRRDGKPRSCDPRLFTAAPDVLLLGRSDGRYEDVTVPAGIQSPQGKGLGVVAADLTGAGFLDLLIANDGTANFLYVNQTAARGGTPVFLESGLAAGVAFGEDGGAEASMGIAADDIDGDGRLDFVVTNFYDEGSACYHQIGERLFEDARRDFGLRNPSLRQLGFGTQFLDADLDGHPDLIVTNGHIEDFTDQGKPYQMPPQFFRNDQGRRFVERPPESLGPFFAGRYLGRGLARLDWNRDGREEAVICHLGTPAALLLNRTARVGNYLALSLVGTDSARDAVGTIVEYWCKGRRRVRQLTAGDGYMASNEKKLVLGLGDAVLVDRLIIRWPSGQATEVCGIAPNGHYLAIENRQALLCLPVESELLAAP